MKSDRKHLFNLRPVGIDLAAGMGGMEKVCGRSLEWSLG